MACDGCNVVFGGNCAQTLIFIESVWKQYGKDPYRERPICVRVRSFCSTWNSCYYSPRNHQTPLAKVLPFRLKTLFKLDRKKIKLTKTTSARISQCSNNHQFWFCQNKLLILDVEILWLCTFFFFSVFIFLLFWSPTSLLQLSWLLNP